MMKQQRSEHREDWSPAEGGPRAPTTEQEAFSACGAQVGGHLSGRTRVSAECFVKLPTGEDAKALRPASPRHVALRRPLCMIAPPATLSVCRTPTRAPRRA